MIYPFMNSFLYLLHIHGIYFIKVFSLSFTRVHYYGDHFHCCASATDFNTLCLFDDQLICDELFCSFP